MTDEAKDPNEPLEAADDARSLPASDALDEDLFDFPEVDPMGVSVDSLRREAPPIKAQDTPVEADPSADAGEAPAAMATELEAATAESADTQDQPATEAATQAEGSDLDEDLFDFGDLTVDVPVQRAVIADDYVDPAPVAAAPVDEAPVLDPEPDLEPAAVQAPIPEPAQQVTPDPVPASTPRRSTTPEPAREATPRRRTRDEVLTAQSPAARRRATRAVETPEFDPHLPPSLPAAAPTRRGRTVEVLAACFLLVNATMIFFAWRAGDEFRQTLAHMTGAVSEALARDTSGSQPVEPEPIVEVLPDMPEDPPVTDVSPLDLTRAALDLARQRLNAGEFDEARRGLQRLLANQDRAALEYEHITEAELLIARSYYLEGTAIQEERP